MPTPPSGTVTFLFTDVEGSTALWDVHPETMEEALAVHDQLVRSEVERHGGYVFSTAGDSFAVAFSDPRQALASAVETQRRLARQAWATPTPLKVRMALHSGVAAERDGDYFGTAPSRCARLMGVATGGQLLLSEATYGMVKDRPGEGVSFEDLGVHRLKDLTAPERVFAVRHPELSASGPVRSLTTMPNNLPIQLSSFVGRDRELAEGLKLLRDARLVTVVGVGGSGKTRLALQMAAELLDDHPNGVWLAELAPLGEPSQVLRTVAQSLGVLEEPGQPLEDRILDFVRTRQLLLVLDNCEHVIDEVARVATRLLTSASGLKILTTSRELLGVPGEISYQLRSMYLPDAGVSLESAAEFDAVRLFVSRADTASPGFRLTDANVVNVVQLCRRLDGMPLALELAAARLKVLTVEQVAARLDDRFRLLTGGNRTALPRQRTLGATIDWSYDLLGEEEKRVFDRLSVFSGGFTLEAAEQVCADADLEPWAILDHVAHLVDKSLVVVGENGTQARYRMLETLRQYGQERLAERGETEPVRRRHAEHLSAYVEEAFGNLRGPSEDEWLARLEVELDNFRQALRWAIDSGEGEIGQNLAGLLYRFWMLRSMTSEGRIWLEQVLAVEGGTRRSRGRALVGAGTLAFLHYDAEAARGLLEEGLSLVREENDPLMWTAALNNLAGVYGGRGELERSALLLEELLSRARATGDTETIGFALQQLFRQALEKGEMERGYAMIEEAAALARAAGSRLRLGDVLTAVGIALLTFDDVETAAKYADELYEIGSIPTAPNRHLTVKALVLGRSGDFAASRQMIKGLAGFRLVADYQQISGVLQEVLVQVAKIEFDSGQPERAALVLSASERLPAQPHPLPSDQAFFDRTMGEIRSALDTRTFDEAWKAGSEMTIDELIDFVVADPTD